MSGRLSRRKEKLWIKNPNCHWCQQPTILAVLLKKVKQEEFPNLATIDHLTTKTQGRIGGLTHENTVLACYKCNQERNEKELHSIPVEERRKRSKFGQLKKKAGIFLKKEIKPTQSVISANKDVYEGIVDANQYCDWRQLLEIYGQN